MKWNLKHHTNSIDYILDDHSRQHCNTQYMCTSIEFYHFDSIRICHDDFYFLLFLVCVCTRISSPVRITFIQLNLGDRPKRSSLANASYHSRTNRLDWVVFIIFLCLVVLDNLRAQEYMNWLLNTCVLYIFCHCMRSL